MGKFKDLLKKNENSKLITIILVGLLILVIVMPVDSCGKDRYGSGVDGALVDSKGAYGDIGDYYSSEADIEDENFEIDNIESTNTYYEDRLKDILEQSDGKDSMEVMVNVKQDTDKGLYGDMSSRYAVDGVLVVAKLSDASKAADISNAICALFNLPACKVAVIIKNNM